jgi:hypothetical protein
MFVCIKFSLHMCIMFLHKEMLFGILLAKQIVV